MAIRGINVLNIVKLEPWLLDLHVLACVLPLFSSSIVFRSQMYVSILTLLFFVEIYKKTIFWVIRSLRWPHLIDDIPLCVTHDTTKWSVVSVSVCEDDSERSSEEWEGDESAFHTYVKWICILINALQLSWYAKQHVLMAAICRGAQAKQRIGYSFTVFLFATSALEWCAFFSFAMWICCCDVVDAMMSFITTSSLHSCAQIIQTYTHERRKLDSSIWMCRPHIVLGCWQLYFNVVKQVSLADLPV